MLYPNVCLSFRLLNKRSTYSHLEAVKISNHRAESIRSHVRHVLLPMLKNLPVQANKNIDSKITTKNDECKNLDNNNQTLRSGFYRIGRQRYTLMEDEAIMKYLLENNLWRRVRSRALWKEMAKEGVTSHSSESMRARFRHHLVNSVYARLLKSLTKNEQVELHNIFFGGSKRYTNPMEENKYNDALSDDGACHSSYSIDECKTSPTTVQRDKFGDVLPDPTKSFSPFLRDQISVCSYESPKRFCNNYPRPPTIIATNTKKASESNDLPNASTSLSSLNESLLELIQGAPSQDSSSPSYLSLMTSDSSPSFDPMKYPVWVSKLINCTSYITTPLQAILLVYMTNGSVAEAYNFLTTGKRRPSSITNFSPPLWSPDDDECLGSTDQNKLDELVSRFGWIEIVKRVGFLQNKNNIDTSDIIKK
ncbi:unnamed protein product [Schistosoma curassoni]|uniref:Telomeric repeat-binding factor 2-interacting protein 1 n=1 Tax=Schistosoma curassoni TaxID=6186 RepID=A0A183KM02_9TREM|nr:unnamed protein product [Schistosoma curassoni]